MYNSPADVIEEFSIFVLVIFLVTFSRVMPAVSLLNCVTFILSSKISLLLFFSKAIPLKLVAVTSPFAPTLN